MSPSPNTPCLDGRVALVTGSTAGLGQEIACALGRAGAQVALNYCNQRDRAEGALAGFRAAGLSGGLFRADATDAAEIAGLVESVTEALGPIDILVCNATPAQPQRPLEDYRWEEAQAFLDAFVKGPFLLSQQVVASMKARRWGRIVHIGSEVVHEGTPGFSPYVAAKGGQLGLARSLARELAPWNITVNTVSPGWVPVARHASVSAADKAAYLQTLPAGRWGTPHDVAGAVTYLASDAAAFVSGANLHVNGGRTVH